jgi:hypothetical protein
VLLGIWVQATLPKPRKEYFGRWNDLAAIGYFYDFKADGTFAGRILKRHVGGNAMVSIDVSGAWAASKTSLYLTYQHMTTKTRLGDTKGFESQIQKFLNHKIRCHVLWLTPEIWRSYELGEYEFRKAPQP